MSDTYTTSQDVATTTVVDAAGDTETWFTNPVTNGTDAMIYDFAATGNSIEYLYCGTSTNLPSGVLSIADYYTGTNATGTLTKSVVSFLSDGGSVVQTGEAGIITGMALDYSAGNGTGTLNGKLDNYNYSWGATSDEVFYTGLASGVSSLTELFSGINGTGTMSQDTYDFSSGGSQIQWFAGSGLAPGLSEDIFNYDSNGVETSIIYDQSSGTSTQTIYGGLPSGDSDVSQDYSGANASGQLLDVGVAETNGTSFSFMFNYDANGVETSYQESVYTNASGGSQVATAQFSANGVMISSSGSVDQLMTNNSSNQLTQFMAAYGPTAAGPVVAVQAVQSPSIVAQTQAQLLAVPMH